MVVVGRLRAGWGTPFCLCLLSHLCAPHTVLQLARISRRDP